MSRPPEQSHLRYPLTRLLGNGGNIRVLRALVAFGAPLSAVQLARDADMTPQGTRLVLEGLSAQGVVAVHGMSRAQVFALNPRYPFAALLKGFFEAEKARWVSIHERLLEAFVSEAGVRSAWLYGSVARAEDTPASDIDIALMTEGQRPDVVAAVRKTLQAMEDEFQIHISVVALTPADVAGLAPDTGWWAEVCKQAKVLKGLSPLLEGVRCGREKQQA